MAISKGKRAGKPLHGAAKKQKLSAKPSQQSKGKAKASDRTKVTAKGKDHAYDRGTIPIPQTGDDGDEAEGLSDQDVELLEGQEANFLQHLDEKGIARSKKETNRLWDLNKPRPKPSVNDDDLPSLNSDGESEDSWSSGIEDMDNMSQIDSDEGASASGSNVSSPGAPGYSGDSDAEMPYEAIPRKRRKSWEPEENKGISRLPVKLPDGQVQYSTEMIMQRGMDSGLEDEESEIDTDDEKLERAKREASPKVEDVSTGARFGRPAVVDVLGNESRQARIEGAKEQIGSICQEILADPENGLGLLRRLHTFSLPEVSTPSHPEPVPNDTLIRHLTIISQYSVFKDIIPDYRIRPLTDKEKAEKVGQIVQRQRDFEQGLVRVYQTYLLALEAEVKAKSKLAETALRCICRLLEDVTHFNFRVNLMTAVVSQLSKKSWTETSALCLNTVVSVLRKDLTGEASLDIVRLLNRMIKERRFNVHPNVLTALLHLRLTTELGGVRASDSKANQENEDGRKPKKVFKKGARKDNKMAMIGQEQHHLSKTARKKMRELHAIKDEMREADAEVDQKQRATQQTETLKLVFALYFRILKNPQHSILLPTALQGISRFAHLVNVDFFKDLMNVLKEIVGSDPSVSALIPDGDMKQGKIDPEAADDDEDVDNIALRLQCIITAFELLTGQGEALNIDLTDFVTHLYSLIIPLSLQSNIETPLSSFTLPPPPATRSSSTRPQRPLKSQTPATLLFRALSLVFSSSAKTSAASHAPVHRTASFSKRLLTVCLHFPSPTALRTLDFVNDLLLRTSALDGMIPSNEIAAESGVAAAGIGSVGGGIYRPLLDDPELCSPFATVYWELDLLARLHADEKVRKAAKRLLSYHRS